MAQATLQSFTYGERVNPLDMNTLYQSKDTNLTAYFSQTPSICSGVEYTQTNTTNSLTFTSGMIRFLDQANTNSSGVSQATFGYITGSTLSITCNDDSITRYIVALLSNTQVTSNLINSNASIQTATYTLAELNGLSDAYLPLYTINNTGGVYTIGTDANTAFNYNTMFNFNYANATLMGNVFNGANELLQLDSNALIATPDITINFGAGQAYTTLASVIAYVKTLVFSSIVINQTSATVENVSVDISNECNGTLNWQGNGFLVDFSATLGNNLTISGNNINVNNINVKANHDTAGALTVTGTGTHNSGVQCYNISAVATAYDLQIIGGSLIGSSSNITLLKTVNSSFIYNEGAILCNNMTVGTSNSGATTNGSFICNGTFSGAAFNGGNDCANFISICATLNFGGVNSINDIRTLTTMTDGGRGCNNYSSSLTTMTYGGINCKNTVFGSITTMTNGGNNCVNLAFNYVNNLINGGCNNNNYFGGLITTLTAGTTYSLGDGCNNFFGRTSLTPSATVNFAGGANPTFNFGNNCKNTFGVNFTSTSTLINFNLGSNCVNQFLGTCSLGANTLSTGSNNSNLFVGAVTLTGGTFISSGNNKNYLQSTFSCATYTEGILDNNYFGGNFTVTGTYTAGNLNTYYFGGTRTGTGIPTSQNTTAMRCN